jgi:hypothetical protein
MPPANNAAPTNTPTIKPFISAFLLLAALSSGV